MARGAGRARSAVASHRGALRLEAAGIPIRAGLHTGEIEQRGADVGEIAVHVGARVMNAAGSGEVLVSQTVRDLVAGSDIALMGADSSKTQADNWADAKTIWPEIVSHARDAGVRIALENCPMIFSTDEWPSGQNLAYSPSIWRSSFEEFGETIGLCFDPSHLVWLMIDIENAIMEFGRRFYFFQAKDVMIDRRGLYEHGVMSVGIGWQVPRLPGLGDVDWGRVFSALYRVGYDGAISIEHEDRGFEGSDELVKRGFLLARDVLAPYVK